MRKDIEFKSKGLTCRGWLYLPDDLPEGKKAAAVVMAHGFSAVKEMLLANFAERFSAAGLAVLVFDYRFLGESEGEPRCQILPHEQLEDYKNAITWVSQQPQVDPDRLGVWGTSYSGGHVLHLAAFDRRIKSAVAQVPNICAWKSVLKQQGQDALLMLAEMTAMDRKARYADQTVNYLPVVAPEDQVSVLATPDALEFFAGKGEDAYPTWKNQVSVETLEHMIEYNPADAVEIISPTPLLMIAAETDSLIPVDQVKETFERAREPKKLVVLPCGHFDVYEKAPWHDQAASAATDWFTTHL
ncbi:MAG: alpha/beta hydrolase [Proteobacteria bacterium]|nr:alpha/beta hydrolase [Pseudomonadota bacterium]